ncbi:serine/arginine repetitive matrix protein 2 [Anaerovorax sp. IOR16]|uniref:serine/arginine repetitive matrix protein 2 n=1 Tax=Anaerovorax sp. IOR16 TaxID=2773458 RepID=UPI0019D2FEB9|nr:serine/arginine repetitive matrix protein 2 [Anaerovorax sp. IOR16]
MFEKFKDYMFYLLHSPLKKVSKQKNQFYILFKVLGKIFDHTKEDIFKVREQSMIVSASGKMLDEHGKDRGMKRLPYEDDDYYRNRLMLKKVIAEKAGTNEGILLALRAMGYENSYIEPFYMTDAERWAEFIVYLNSKEPSKMDNLTVIDSEIMKVKAAGSKPSYGLASAEDIQIKTEGKLYPFKYPLCNTILCGTYPDEATLGRINKADIGVNGEYKATDNPEPFCGDIASSEAIYQEYKYTDFNGHNAEIEVDTSQVNTVKQYNLCGVCHSGEVKV